MSLPNIRIALLSLMLFSVPLVAHGTVDLIAFTGAEGFGASARGGRGGRVIEVTNLNDNGPGSLREAIEAEGPRTVVFRVSGNIRLEKSLVVKNPFLTIAGQTAPGDGICLRDAGLVIAASEVIVRFLRIRPGDESGYSGDSLSVSSGENIIIDHCSCTWAIDETLSVSSGDEPLDKVTVQYCIISESLNDSHHAKGRHGYGSLIRGFNGSRFTFHHNLFSHHQGRSPRPGVYDKWDVTKDPKGLLLEFRNNVIYDWAGSHAGYNADKVSVTRMDYVGNELIAGKSSAPGSVAYSEGSPFNRSYFADNRMNGESFPDDPYVLVRFPKEYTPEIIRAYRQETSVTGCPDSETISPEDAYRRVLSEVGAFLPRRDEVDERLLRQVRERTGGLIDSQSEVGGWPDLKSEPAPVDSDHDGMPDEWEIANDLDPNDPADGSAEHELTYFQTNLEVYLDWLVGEGLKRMFPAAD